MDLDLLKFINSDLTWNSVKKGNRTRRPRRPGARNTVQDTVVDDYEKSGVAILGQHFADVVLDVPIKKRILLRQSPSLSGEQARSPQSPLCVHHEESKLDKKEVPDLNDFSGIELLADAAFHSSVPSVSDNPDQVESSEVEAQTTPKVDSHTATPKVDSHIGDIKVDITPMESDESSIQDSTVPVTQHLCDNGNGESDKSHVPSKTVRFHWDLNTVMEEWEEHCDLFKNTQSEESHLKDIDNDGLQNAKADINFQATEVEKESTLHDAAISVVPYKPETFGTQGNNDGGSTESCISKSDVVDSFVHPAKCENISTSTDSVSLGQSSVKDEPLIKSDEGQAVSEVVQGGCLSLKGDDDDKPTLEDRLSDFCGSNASEDEQGNTIENVKAGYDSPVEDGELREPTSPYEEVEERECVDYESDNMYEDNFDTIDSVENETSLDQCQTTGALGLETVNNIEQGTKVDVFSRPNHHKNSQSAILEEKYEKSGNLVSERKSVHDEFRGGNMWSLDRSTSTSFDMRKKGAYIPRSRCDNFGDTYSRGERDFGPEKIMGRPSYHGRVPNNASGQWCDSFSRNSHGYSRPKIVSGGSSSIDRNQPINHNPRGNYRPLNTRPSPAADRNESFNGPHRGPPPARGISGRFRRGPQEYNPSEQCYPERKNSSFSSTYNQGAHISRSRKRSRSRSRSGSPIAWHFQKKPNVETKRESPDYRSNTRLPFRKPSEVDAGFVPPTSGRGFVSPTRGRVSPHCVSRSFDDRNIINGQYRDMRASPVKNFHRDQRFEAGGYPGRVKSNDNFCPIRPPTREKFEANSDDKYGMMNRGKPFRYDADDSFKPHNKDNGFRYTRNENRSFRDLIRKDLANNTSEKNGCRYTTNKMFNTGVGDFHKDNLQRE